MDGWMDLLSGVGWGIANRLTMLWADKESVCTVNSLHCKLYSKLDWQSIILCGFSHLPSSKWECGGRANQIKCEEELWQSEQFCANSKRRQSPPMVNHHQPAQFYQQHQYRIKRCSGGDSSVHVTCNAVELKIKVNLSKHEELGQNALERSASWSWLGQNAWNVFSYEENRMFLRLGCLLLFSRNWKENRNCKMFWL